MIQLLKGLVPGTILTWVVSLILGSNHARGGFLNIHKVEPIAGFDFYWSWPLFLASTALAWFIFTMLD